MTTNEKLGEVAQRLFGKTRHAVLGLLYGQPDREFYQQEITREVGVNLSAVQRELRNLVEADVVTFERRGNRVYYRANRAAPIFADLQGMVLKTVGLADVLRSALEPLREKISIAFVFGSLAAGGSSSESDVDLMIIGSAGLRELAPVLSTVSDRLGREVNPVTLSPDEWEERLRDEDHFLSAVAREPKIIVLGVQDELDRLGGIGPTGGA